MYYEVTTTKDMLHINLIMKNKTRLCNYVIALEKYSVCV